LESTGGHASNTHFQIHAANFTSAETISGSYSSTTESLTFTNTDLATISDTNWINTARIESVLFYGTANAQSITLGTDGQTFVGSSELSDTVTFSYQNTQTGDVTLDASALTNGSAKINFTAGSGNNYLTDGNDADTITSGAGNSTFVTGSGASHLVAGSGNDLFIVGSASPFMGVNDHSSSATIDGGSGSSSIRLTSTTANDDLVINSHDVNIHEVDIATGTGATGVFTGTTALEVNASLYAHSLVIVGNAGADTIQAGTGGDSIVAGNGNDLLVGGTGSGVDTITAGTGTDTIEGGHTASIYNASTSGTDTFQFTATSQLVGDTINNFIAGTDVFSGFNTLGVVGVGGSGTDITAASVLVSGNQAVVDAAAVGSIILDNTTAISSFTNANVATAFGTLANSVSGDHLILEVHTASQTALYYYVATDSVVADGTLTQIAVLTGTHASLTAAEFHA